MKKKILRYILNYYLKSKDCNGCPITKLIEKYKDIIVIKQILIELLQEETIELYISDYNHFIKLFDQQISLCEQIKKINDFPDDYKQTIIKKIKIKGGPPLVIVGDDYNTNFTIFPSIKIIEKTISNKKKYLELPPFEKMLLRGMPHLNFLYFRIDVLNRFLYDPRYVVYNRDYTGNIYYKMEDDAEEWQKNENHLYLKHFGLGYNQKTNENVITIFPGDLAKLSPKHQYHFYSYLLDNQGDHIPDLSYYKNIMGHWSEGISIFSATFDEMNIINQMTEMICGKKLLKNIFNFTQDNRPEYFHPYLMPTQTMYGNFCRTLIRIFADRLNKKAIKAFAKSLGVTILDKTPDGKDKGSLTMLQEIFSQGFRAFDGSDTGLKIVNVWKNEINVNRSKSAHNFIDDLYDIKIFDSYRKTINEAYKSIRLIRLVLTTHPTVKKAIKNKTIEIPDDLYSGNIHIYFSPLKISDTEN